MIPPSEERECIGEPVSWLRLERYHLGELEGEDVTQIDAHVDRCEVCRSCLGQITAGMNIPPLVFSRSQAEVEESSEPDTVVEMSTWKRRRRAVVTSMVTTTLAAAAAYMLFVRPIDESVIPSSQVRIKGGDVALSVVAKRAGRIVENPASFELNDQLKIEFTSPPTMNETFELVVFQSGEVSFPFTAQTSETIGGNRRVWPGAFALDTEEDATVCVAWGEAARLLRQGTTTRAVELGDDAVCRMLAGMK